jgi:hypothetical protein
MTAPTLSGCTRADAKRLRGTDGGKAVTFLGACALCLHDCIDARNSPGV